jgi:hypothetical protein
LIWTLPLAQLLPLPLLLLLVLLLVLLLAHLQLAFPHVGRRAVLCASWPLCRPQQCLAVHLPGSST